MGSSDIGHLVEAIRFHAEQQERWAHGDYYWHMNRGQRKELAAEGTQPWRGAMSPSILHVINILEDLGHYEPTGLTVPKRVA